MIHLTRAQYRQGLAPLAPLALMKEGAEEDEAFESPINANRSMITV
jgi:hypothetical protein